MKELQKLPDAELSIMMAIWEAGEPVNSDYLMKKLNKSWTKPTLLQLLSRMCDRGFVKVSKQGRINIYEAAVRQQDYLQQESGLFLKKLHRNSLTSLVASLYDGKNISKSDLDELKIFIEEAE